jgi:hypothetical protein
MQQPNESAGPAGMLLHTNTICVGNHDNKPKYTCPFGHYIVFLSSIYSFWLSLWYLQTFLERKALVNRL